MVRHLNMRRRSSRWRGPAAFVLAVLVSVLASTDTARAQQASSIAGVVRDSAGLCVAWPFERTETARPNRGIRW